MNKLKSKLMKINVDNNKIGIISAFGSIIFAFMFIVLFYLSQKPSFTINDQKHWVYKQDNIHVWLFWFGFIFFIEGAIAFEYFLIMNIKSLRKNKNWTWKDKSKLQTRLITIPSVIFFFFVLFMFGSLFITGTTMSTYGYSKIQKIYLITCYSLSGMMTLFMIWAFRPWTSPLVFNNLTNKYKK